MSGEDVLNSGLSTLIFNKNKLKITYHSPLQRGGEKPPKAAWGRGFLLIICLIVLYQLRQYFFNSACDNVVGNLVDRSIRVVVN